MAYDLIAQREAVTNRLQQVNQQIARLQIEADKPKPKVDIKNSTIKDSKIVVESKDQKGGVTAGKVETKEQPNLIGNITTV